MAKRKSRVITKGFAHTRKALDVPESPAGFEWPAFRGDAKATPEVRQKFGGSLTQLMSERGINHMEFAGQFLGESTLPNGHVQRAGAAQVRKWIDGSSFPSAMSARKIGAFFQVPMSRLLEYSGPRIELPYLRQPKGTKRKVKLNGHGGNGHAAVTARGGDKPAPTIPELAPPRVIPEGAQPVVIKIETLPSDSGWAHVMVGGTFEVDVALGLLAYIERHKSQS